MRSIRKSRTSIGCSAKRPPPKLSDPTRSVLRQAVVGIVHVDPVGFGKFPDIGNDIGPAFVRQAGKDDSREPGFKRHVPQHPARRLDVQVEFQVPPVLAPVRSEEHTSELQSLMRISYAVFCLKKKTTNSITIIY